jgi:ubiquinone biosynthesis protein
VRRLLRLLRILVIALRYGLHEFIPPLAQSRLLAAFCRERTQPAALRLRLALEALGPIFVKFGQVLSTRRDLLPQDVADELARLQDQVPPFASADAVAEIEHALERPIEAVFARFEQTPVASASIAQVHLATLRDGSEVAVKVLRPRVERTIGHDVLLLETAAALMERLWVEGRRLKPREVVAEFSRSCGATSKARRCSRCRASTGTTARSASW